jgi:hypothetical protein
MSIKTIEQNGLCLDLDKSGMPIRVKLEECLAEKLSQAWVYSHKVFSRFLGRLRLWKSTVQYLL